MNSTHTPHLTVPLSAQAHALARQFAAEQLNPHHGKQIYLNTLAVYAVHTYLSWIRIDTDLSLGDCWQPALQPILDVADLMLPGLGKLECRPILPGETVCPLPPETLNHRIGYIGVQFHEQLDRVDLIGFVPVAVVEAITESQPEQISVEQFQPLATLAEYFHQLRSAQSAMVAKSTAPIPAPVNLSAWLQNSFEAGWQALEELLGGGLRPAFNFRTDRASGAIAPAPITEPPAGVRRGKLIELSGQPTAYIAALVVRVTPKGAAPEMRHEVLLQVYPTRDQRYLPPNLQLMVLDESDRPILDAAGNPLQVCSRQADNFIQLLLRGRTGEQFRVRLVLGEVSVTEEFVI